MSKEAKITHAMSRYRLNIIFALCLLLIAVVIWLDHNPIRLKWQQPESEKQLIFCDLKRYHGNTFNVVNVVDGDTIDIDSPDRQYKHTRIRLWGVDAPETKNPKVGVMYFGPQAAEFTTKSVLGKKITVYLDEGSSTRGKYDRLLAYIQLPDSRFLNELLLTEGFAYADLRFRHSLYYKYKQLEAAARSKRRGLWEKVKREQWPEWRH